MPRRIRRWSVLAVPAVTVCAAGAWAATVPNPVVVAPEAKPPHAAAAARAGAEARTAAVRWAGRRAAHRHARLAARTTRREAARRRAQTAIRAATSRAGRPYSMGATGPHAFDCSGLTQWSMRRAGVELPRTSFAQAGTGMPVRRSRIRAGDLVFFSTAGAGASHVGIATSRSSVVSATSHGVMRHAIDDAYWGSHYVAARRVATAR
ncbi:MAG: murein DD-endopeptidase / murein LD-carboxypeptidase [Solirubrobacteraceae bacterium]|nr:murein DD-endopeptidase / murein LD-carboxypeptidase [Solirubrobacteraceae bacterium]